MTWSLKCWVCLLALLSHFLFCSKEITQGDDSNSGEQNIKPLVDKNSELEEKSKKIVKKNANKDVRHNKNLNLELCNKEVAQGCYNVGNILLREIYSQPGEEHPSEKYFRKARKLGEKICNSGNLRDCYMLSELWSYGMGGIRDFKKSEELELKAIRLAQDSCAKGDSNDCLFLAIIFDNNENIEQANKYYRKSCEKGNPTGCSIVSFRDGL